MTGIDAEKAILSNSDDRSSLNKLTVGDDDSKAEGPSELTIDLVVEKHLLWKMDAILVPLCTIIYMLNFLDRTVVGNARVAGLEKELGMLTYDLNITLSLFYVTYILADAPSNLVMRKIGSIWLSFLVLSFGLVTLGSTWMRTRTDMYLNRIFLGMTEGGVLSGIVYLLSRYYRRTELVARIGWIFGIAPGLAGSTGGFIASAVLKVPDFGSVKSWRKIFFIEGIVTIILALLLFVIMPEDPTKSRILNEAERRTALARIDADQVIKTGGQKEKFKWKLLPLVFNPITFIIFIPFVFMNMMGQGLGLFLPSVIRAQGTFTVVQIQLRTIPPNVAGTIWAVLSLTLSGRIKRRYPIFFANAILFLVASCINLATLNPKARYTACHFILMAAGSTGPMILAYITDNSAPDTVRAAVNSIMPALGAIGPIAGIWTYNPHDAPHYIEGSKVNLGGSVAIAVSVVAVTLWIHLENRKRDRGERNYRLEGKTEEEIADLGHLHPDFRYQI